MSTVGVFSTVEVLKKQKNYLPTVLNTPHGTGDTLYRVKKLNANFTFLRNNFQLGI